MIEHGISDKEFHQFRDLMHKVAGVDLSDSKKHLVNGRLLRRLRARNLTSFSEYFRIVSSGQDTEEFHLMVDLLTTHETYFFREPKHFDYLANHVLKHIQPTRPFRVWSAASSTGEEAYSLAMVLMDCLGPTVSWEIFASDISHEVLAKARSGVYSTSRIEGLSTEYLQRYCLRGVGSRAGTLRVVPEIRERVQFAPINLNTSLAAVGDFDVVFLRNVLIYFNPHTKEQIVNRIIQQIRPQGWLFIGHSESLSGMSTPLLQERPTIYRRD